MSIEWKFVYPRPAFKDDNYINDGTPGINYRQWLIGQAVAGLGARDDVTLDTLADWSVSTADRIIEILDKED
jgi:hypothetical protein